MSKDTNSLPPLDVLRWYFRVDSEYRVHRRSKTHGWKQASRIRKGAGYAMVNFQGESIQAHRLIWALHHGRHPTGMIDHINGKKWDNRIENLREATAQQNRWNRPMTSKNSTGYRGVFKTASGYRGRTVVGATRYESPAFDDPELAELAATAMRERLHGPFAWRAA